MSQGDGIVSEFFPIPEVKCEALSDPWHVYMRVFTQWISQSTFSLPCTALGCGDQVVDQTRKVLLHGANTLVGDTVNRLTSDSDTKKRWSGFFLDRVSGDE